MYAPKETLKVSYTPSALFLPLFPNFRQKNAKSKTISGPINLYNLYNIKYNFCNHFEKDAQLLWRVCLHYEGGNRPKDKWGYFSCEVLEYPSRILKTLAYTLDFCRVFLKNLYNEHYEKYTKKAKVKKNSNLFRLIVTLPDLI